MTLPTPATEQQLNNGLWAASAAFCGALSATSYKDYVLVMLFLKYISGLDRARRAEYETRYPANQDRVQRAMSRERFVVPPESGFDYLYEKRDDLNLGGLINRALDRLADANQDKLHGLFKAVDFNADDLGRSDQRNHRLARLLEELAKLDLPTAPGSEIGTACELLIARFANAAGKRGGEIATSAELSTLLAKLLAPRPGARICDPLCGSGSLLIRLGREVDGGDFALYGQEIDPATWAMCKINLFLHGMDSARIECCNTIVNPLLVRSNRLMKFDIVVADPPLSAGRWGHEVASGDTFKRFKRGIPPSNRGTYAFISHLIEIAADDGRIGVIVPLGVLFRGGSEGAIRRQLITQNLLEAVIGLPPNLLYGAAIPVAILIFDRARTSEDVLFIDASQSFQPGRNINQLTSAGIDRIVGAFADFATIPGFARRVSPEEIRDQAFNCNIPLYVGSADQVTLARQSIPNLENEIAQLAAELAGVRQEIAGHLKELSV